MTGYQIVSEAVDKKEKLNESVVITAIVTSIISLVAQAAILISIFKWAKRKSKLHKDLTDKLQKITKKKHIKVFIAPIDKIQAFPSPTGEIFLTSGLYDMLNEDENIAVALHEAGHVIYQAHMTSFAVADVLVWSLMAIHPVLGYVAGSAGLFAMVGAHERLADSYATKMRYGDALISALKKTYASSKSDNLFGPIGKILGKIDRLLHLHPHLEERIENILKKKEVVDAVKKGDKNKAKRAVNK